MVTFLSKPYGGHSSDSFITTDSDFASKLEDGDEVLADKGFPEIKVNGQAITIIPPRARKGQKRFTREQMAKTKKIASVRIHVERAIQRLKIFKILSHRLDHRMLPHVKKIITVIAWLVNNLPPLI